MKQLTRAVPSEFVSASFELRLELVCIARTQHAVGTVSSNNQIGFWQHRRIVDESFKLDFYSGTQACFLKNIQHVDARRSRKIVAMNLNMATLMDYVHVAAAFVRCSKFGEKLFVGFAQEI